jgi:hypothetical protein
MRHRLALLSCVTTLALILVTAPTRAQDMKPDEEGFIRDWLILGPFPIAESSGQDEIDKKQIPEEAAIKPKEGEKQKVGDKEQTWKAVKAKDYHLDLNEALGGSNEDVVGYIVAYVVCDKAMPDLTMLMGSNDQGKVYVNGKEVVKNDTGRSLEKDTDKAEHVNLDKGSNVIVFKVINEKNNWEACLRFVDKAGKPVTNYTVKLAP